MYLHLAVALIGVSVAASGFEFAGVIIAGASLALLGLD